MKPNIQKNLPLLLTIGAIVLVGVSFVLGMQAQKLLAKSSSTTASSQGQQGAGSQFGGGFAGARGQGRRPTLGTVTSFDGTTIIMTNSQSGATTKVTVSASTQVTDSSGNAASATDIKTGDTVSAFGTTGSDGTVSATRIRLNPTIPSSNGATNVPSTSVN
jgi:hypothetical protein